MYTMAYFKFATSLIEVLLIVKSNTEDHSKDIIKMNVTMNTKG